MTQHRRGLTPLFCKMVSLALLSALVFVPRAETALSDRVSEKVLPNGLKVLLLENHRAPVVTFQVWYRVGSRNEDHEKTGLSHALEHMMFKGTETIGPDELSRKIQENGGNYNAFTSYDFTTYFENMSADRIQVALDLEADRMKNLMLREQDFETERKVVMEERRLRTEDNPKAFTMEQLAATAFQRQPYRWPIIGWMEDIARLTMEDLKFYYWTYYTPSNAFLVVAGDFEKEDMLPRIEAAFGSIPKQAAPNQDRTIDPPQTGERRIIVKREAQLPFFAMAFRVPNIPDPDSYTLAVIASLLSGGKSSRLYHRLVREKQLVLDVEADHSLLSRDPGLFLIAAEVLPGEKAADIEKAVDQELERLRRDPVEPRELQKVKNQLEAAFISGQDSLFFQAMVLARHEIVNGWRTVDDYIPSIRKVTPEDIQRVANRYLIRENRTVATLVPLPRAEAKPVSEPFSIRSDTVR